TVRIAFGTVPTLVGNNGGILPYATVSGTDFATYDSVNNNSVAAFTGYATSLAAAGPGDTVKLTGPDVLTGNKTINALLLAGGAIGSGTVTLISGIVQGLAAGSIPNALALNNSSVTVGGLNNLTFTGPVTLNNTTDANGAAYTNTLSVATTAVQTVILGGAIT